MSGVISALIEKTYRTSPKNLPPGSSSILTLQERGRVGKPNAALFRNWAEHGDWVRGAIRFLKTQVSQSEWDVVPYDRELPYDERQQDEMRALFARPNQMVESFRSFIEPIVEDILTLDAGCVEKERTVGGKLVYLHAVDGGKVLVSTLWDGDPAEPRYYWAPSPLYQVPFLNDDMMYIMSNPRTYSVVGLAPLETLKQTIDAELSASAYNTRQVTNAAPDGILNLGESARPDQVESFACYADDTQFLTRGGWRDFDDIGPDDEIAIVDPTTHEMHYEVPRDRYESAYVGPMAHFTGRGLDLLVTPNHRVVTESRFTHGWQLREAQGIIAQSDLTIPVAVGAWNCAQIATFTLPQQEWLPGRGHRDLKRVEPIAIRDWLEFLGYVISEGYVAAVGWGAEKYAVGISQNVGAKADRIQACLDRLPFHVSRTNVKNGRAYHWRIWDKSLWTYLAVEIGQGARNKHIPQELLQLDRDHLRVLFDALMLGDGHWVPTPTGGNGTYATASPLLADQVQEIAVKLGLRSAIRHRRNQHGDDWFTVQLAQRSTARCLTTQWVEYSGRIVCFTVSTGVLVARRNGNVAICGNSYWKQEVAGRGALAFLGGTKGAAWMPLRATNRDMQFAEWQEFLVRKISVVFGVSMQDLNQTADINRSEGEVQTQKTESSALRPLLSLLQDYLTREVVWDESLGGSANNLAFRFTRLNIKESLDKAQLGKLALAGMPWKPINEQRADEGRPPMAPPGMDPMDPENPYNRLIANTPLGLVSPEDVLTAAEAATQGSTPADSNGKSPTAAGSSAPGPAREF
jgi:phage portal protein BeeE